MFVKIMEPKQCSQCGNQLRYIKAGVSKKTGKPYNAFYACPEGCKQEYQPREQKPARSDLNASGKDKISIANEMLLKLDELVRGQKLIIDLLQKRDDEDISGVPFK